MLHSHAMKVHAEVFKMHIHIKCRQSNQTFMKSPFKESFVDVGIMCKFDHHPKNSALILRPILMLQWWVWTCFFSCWPLEKSTFIPVFACVQMFEFDYVGHGTDRRGIPIGDAHTYIFLISVSFFPLWKMYTPTEKIW